MEGINEFPGSGPISDQNEQQKIGHEKEFIILILTNAIFFFLQTAYILYEKGMYRLVALRNNRVILDKNYKTLKGAKIAFTKFFKDACWKANTAVSWSSEYHPEQELLEKNSCQDFT